MEIVRRYFAAVEVVRRTGVGDEQVDRLKLIMKAGIDKTTRRHARRSHQGAAQAVRGAMVMPDGSVVTGRPPTRLGAQLALS
ncbi:MAG: hypothetical protein ACLVKA_03305 [Collinsella aerofaciens]